MTQVLWQRREGSETAGKEKKRKQQGWRSHTSEGKTVELLHKLRTFCFSSSEASTEIIPLLVKWHCVWNTEVSFRVAEQERTLCSASEWPLFFGVLFFSPSINTASERRWDAGLLWLTTCVRVCVPMASLLGYQAPHPAVLLACLPVGSSWGAAVEILPPELTTDGLLRVPTAAVFGPTDVASSHWRGSGCWRKICQQLLTTFAQSVASSKQRVFYRVIPPGCDSFPFDSLAPVSLWANLLFSWC